MEGYNRSTYVWYIMLASTFLSVTSIHAMSVARVQSTPPLQAIIHSLNQSAQKHCTFENYVKLFMVSMQLYMISNLSSELLRKLYPWYKLFRNNKLKHDLEQFKRNNKEIANGVDAITFDNPTMNVCDLTKLIQDYTETDDHIKEKAYKDIATYQYYQKMLHDIGPLLPYIALGIGVQLACMKKISEYLYQESNDTSTIEHSPDEPEDPDKPRTLPLLAKLHLLIMVLGIANSYIPQ